MICKCKFLQYFFQLQHTLYKQVAGILHFALLDIENVPVKSGQAPDFEDDVSDIFLGIDEHSTRIRNRGINKIFIKTFLNLF